LGGTAGPTDHSEFSAERFLSFATLLDVNTELVSTINSIAWAERVRDTDRATWEQYNLNNRTYSQLMYLPTEGDALRYVNLSGSALPVPHNALDEYYAMVHIYPERHPLKPGIVFSTVDG
jgi:hypothetical protein